MDNPFIEKMQALSDTALLKVIELRAEYQSDAVDAAKQVAIQRGLLDDNFNYIKLNDQQLSELGQLQKDNQKRIEKEEKRNKNKKRRIIIWFVIIVVFCIGGYYLYSNWKLDKVKEIVRTSIEEKTKEKIITLTIVHKQGNEYDGLAEFESKLQMQFDLTVDGDNALWKSNGKYELQKGLQGLYKN